MIEIISKSNGPRREDAAAKHFLRENASTINRIANQLGGGRPSRQPAGEPPAANNSTRRRSAPSNQDDKKSPYTNVTMNNRVIAVDFNSGRQLHHLGDIRGQGATRRFILATQENRYFTPLEDDLVNKLRDLDGFATPSPPEEQRLVQAIDERLGYSQQETNR